jgi:hypothetical protein
MDIDRGILISSLVERLVLNDRQRHHPIEVFMVARKKHQLLIVLLILAILLFELHRRGRVTSFDFTRGRYVITITLTFAHYIQDNNAISPLRCLWKLFLVLVYNRTHSRALCVLRLKNGGCLVDQLRLIMIRRVDINYALHYRNEVLPCMH